MRNIGHIDPQAQEPAFAPEILEAMFGDAPGVIAAVLNTFCSSMGQQLRLLQLAVAASDTLAQQVIAHRIKGAAFMSGAMALGRAAERLELAARGAPTASEGQIGCDAAAAAIVQQWARLPDDGSFCRAREGG